MPNRILRDWTDSDPIDTLSWIGEVFFTRLIMKADDYGRFHAEPCLLRASLFPRRLDKVREADIPRLLAECEKAGLIALYKADGKKFLEIRKFGQTPRSAKSKFPDPVQNCNGSHEDCAQPARSPPTSCNHDAPVFDDVSAFGNGDRKQFKPPSLDEVVAYCKERGNSVDAERFIDHYTANGWKVGKSAMKDWKAAVRNWEKNDFSSGSRSEQSKFQTPEEWLNQ